jgi:predicted transcriptional regulator
MKSTTVRISAHTHQLVQDLAQATGKSRQAVVQAAVEAYRRRTFLEAANTAFARTCADEQAHVDYAAEQEAWDVTVGDGLDDAESTTGVVLASEPGAPDERSGDA